MLECASAKSGEIKNFTELPISGESPDENGNIYDLAFSLDGHLVAMAVTSFEAPYTYEGAGVYIWSVKSFTQGYQDGVAPSIMEVHILETVCAKHCLSRLVKWMDQSYAKFISNSQIAVLRDKHNSRSPKLKVTVYSVDPFNLNTPAVEVQSITIEKVVI